MNDPWNESAASRKDSDSKDGFKDNFTIEKATILELPDSDKYLEALERRLLKIQPKTVIDVQLSKPGHRVLAKDLIATLKAKRDEIFKEELGPDRVDWEDANESKLRTIQQKLMQTDVFKDVTRKVAPHLLAIDAEELKSLTVFDFLNEFSEQSNSEIQRNPECSGEKHSFE